MKLIFLIIALFAFSICYDKKEYSYGCIVKNKQCCWFNKENCCDYPSEDGKPRTCEKKLTLCCKKKVYSIDEGGDVYIYSKGRSDD